MSRRHGAVLVLVSLLLPGVLVTADATMSLPRCFGRTPTIIGTEGDDTLSGTTESDVIVGLGGKDTITGEGRIDFICGGDGDDTISGGRGNDSISGDAGNDLILGGVGNDRVLGSAGNDTLKGQDGDDTLTGGLGTDNTVGGPGTDTCATSETRTSCEVVPPSGCTAGSRVPAIPVTTNVTVVGSNAYHTHSSFGICTGGICDYDYLDFVVELRNDTGSSVRLGKATINIYDALGTKIGTRYANAKADALAPGQATVLTETMPSILFDQRRAQPLPRRLGVLGARPERHRGRPRRIRRCGHRQPALLTGSRGRREPGRLGSGGEHARKPDRLGRVVGRALRRPRPPHQRRVGPRRPRRTGPGGRGALRCDDPFSRAHLLRHRPGRGRRVVAEAATAGPGPGTREGLSRGLVRGRRPPGRRCRWPESENPLPGKGFQWWSGPGSDWRPPVFQTGALPTELPDRAPPERLSGGDDGIRTRDLRLDRPA